METCTQPKQLVIALVGKQGNLANELGASSLNLYVQELKNW